MKLSDAINIGRRGKHQIVGQYWDNSGGVCALGAAIFGLCPENPSQAALIPYPLELLKQVRMWNDLARDSFDAIIALLRVQGH